MLKGTLTYKKMLADGSERIYVTPVSARATSDTLSLHIDAYDNNSVRNLLLGLEGDEYYSESSFDTWFRLDIASTPKYKTNILNHDFCAKVTALFKYAMTGKRMESEGGYDISKSFRLPKDLGFCTCNMGVLSSINMQGKYFSLELAEKEGVSQDEVLFFPLKARDNFGRVVVINKISDKGVKYETEVLGFPYKPVVKRENVNSVFDMLYDSLEDVVKDNPEKEYTWVKGRKYEVVTDARLEEVVEEYRQAMRDGKYIAVDTETTGLKINMYSRTDDADYLVGLCMSHTVGEGHYFSLRSNKMVNLCGGDHNYVMQHYFKPILERGKIVTHNLQYDWKVIYIYSIVLNVVYDTMIALCCTKRYEVENFRVGLKHTVKTCFGWDMFELGDFIKANDWTTSGITFADLPLELVEAYAPADADMTLSVREFQIKTGLLARYGAERIFEIEVNFAKVVAYSEFHGYHIAVEKMDFLRNDIKEGKEKYYKELVALAGEEFNPDSPKQLAHIMFDKLGIPTTDDGSRTTKKEVLWDLEAREGIDGKLLYPFVVSLLKYRGYATTDKNFLTRADEFISKDGFVFPETQQFGTNTGRTSAKEPNYQSYNKTVKKYTTPRKGFGMFDCDFGQVEYRTLAFLSGQQELIDAFADYYLDYHTYQASRMFSIPYAFVTAELRQSAKGINFGLPFGMGDESLGARIFGKRSPENTRKAADLRKRFFEGQGKVEAFFERVRAEGVREGFTSTFFGRRRYYQRGKFSVSSIRRQAGNHVIQGTAADWYKEAVCRVFNMVVKNGWLDKVLFDAFVHDELVMEVSKDIDMFDFTRQWKAEYELVIEGAPPLYAGCGFGDSWLEAKSQDLPSNFAKEYFSADHVGTWDGNWEGFKEGTKVAYENFKLKEVSEFIKDKSHGGAPLKPAIGSLLVELTLREWKSGGIQEKPVALAEAKKADIIAKLNAITANAKKAEKDKIRLDLKDAIPVFCSYYDLDWEASGILFEDDVRKTDTSDLCRDDEEEDPKDIMMDVLRTFGYMLDINSRIIYLRMEGIPNFLDTIKTNYCTTVGTYALCLVDVEKEQVYTTAYHINSKHVSSIQLMYNTLQRV